MLPIDPGDGQGGAPGGQDRQGSGHAFVPPQPLRDVTPARPLRDIVPAQAMAHGGTIIRPGAVAWGGLRDARDSRYSSGESIERILASALADPGLLPALLAELAGTRLWVPLPVRRRPFTDGTAIRLPLIGYTETDTDFVPCFTSVQRLTRWADEVEADARSGAGVDEYRFAGGGGRQWQRAGDARVVPHVVVPAAGLARRLPAGLGLALNPGGAPGLPLFPESVSYLARLDGPTAAAIAVGHPPSEPLALLNAVRARLRGLRFVRSASRAWLTVPGRGEGLVISVALDDPASEQAHQAVIGALLAAVASVPLHVPFPVDVAFADEPAGEGDGIATAPEPRRGEPADDAGGEPAGHAGGEPADGSEADPDLIDMIAQWMARNTRPFYTRD
jgi:hypothetical protein